MGPGDEDQVTVVIHFLDKTVDKTDHMEFVVHKMEIIQDHHKMLSDIFVNFIHKDPDDLVLIKMDIFCVVDR